MSVKSKKLLLFIVFLLFYFICFSSFPAVAQQTPNSAQMPAQETFAQRRALFDQMSALSGIPWYVLAAIDQFERSRGSRGRQGQPPRTGLIAIHFSEADWLGMMNPDQEDQNPQSISFFHGMGRDGNGDGLVEQNNEQDVLYSMTAYLLKYGTFGKDFRSGLGNYYQRAKSVERIEQFAKIYAHFDTLDLFDYVFPLPLRSNYAYHSTWGHARGWGGRRIHEGTDIFAGYGVPVRSASYGIIENKGWNRYGGWRLGIRDLNNNYYYYAHLSGYSKKIKPGDVVKPGQVLGWVGSSGYGKPGTQGKFPPHLHFGMYHDNGRTEWSFNPYSYLKRWERAERKSRMKTKTWQ